MRNSSFAWELFVDFASEIVLDALPALLDILLS